MRRPRLAVPPVLRDEPRFRRLLASQTLSVVGDRVTAVALPFAVLAVGGGLRDVAVVSAAQFLPFVVLALPAGVWADRLDRRAILVASDLVRLACQLVAAVGLLTGSVGVVQLVVVAAVYGAADAFFAPAFSGLLPTTVRPANLQAANALRGLTVSVGSIAGPVLAGLTIALTGGPAAALLLDAATFAVSVLLLVPPRADRGHPAEQVPGSAAAEGFGSSLRHGWVEVRTRSWVLAFLGGWAVYHVAVLPAVFVLGPVLMEQDHGGAESWAVVVTAFGVGCVVGDLVFLRWQPRFALRTGALLLAGASCQAVIIGSGLDLAGIAVLEAVAGLCVTGAFTLWETSLAEHVPGTSLSRVSSYDYLTTTGLIPVGNLLAGTVTVWLGLTTTLVGMSVVGVLAALVVLATPSVRNLGRGTPLVPEEQRTPAELG